MDVCGWFGARQVSLEERAVDIDEFKARVEGKMESLDSKRLELKTAERQFKRDFADAGNAVDVLWKLLKLRKAPKAGAAPSRRRSVRAGGRRPSQGAASLEGTAGSLRRNLGLGNPLRSPTNRRLSGASNVSEVSYVPNPHGSRFKKCMNDCFPLPLVKTLAWSKWSDVIRCRANRRTSTRLRWQSTPS